MFELGCALAVAGVATFHDLRTRTLPDALAIATAVLGVVIHAMHAGWGGVLDAAFGAVACAIFPAIFTARGALGRGDLKLFAALGALLGPLAGLEAQLWTFAAAFVVALAWATWKKSLRGLGSFPLAPAMLAGVLTVALGAR